jgi:hypothetical protein
MSPDHDRDDSHAMNIYREHVPCISDGQFLAVTTGKETGGLWGQNYPAGLLNLF